MELAVVAHFLLGEECLGVGGGAAGDGGLVLTRGGIDGGLLEAPDAEFAPLRGGHGLDEYALDGGLGREFDVEAEKEVVEALAGLAFEEEGERERRGRGSGCCGRLGGDPPG
ncbi:MAG: hypothetical protein JWO80_1552 [Bryobacterales bacterium]|nr:hypothetical protein [Bryobacterales bacterium]